MCVPAQLSELSARGCYVDALQPLAVGTEMRLSICYGANTCELEGKVIYKHSGAGMGLFGMGVVFRHVGIEQHRLIETWLSQLASAQGPTADYVRGEAR
jgi:PilZ domain